MTTAIKPWYKQTKVGIIPNDWDCVKLSSIWKCIRWVSYSPDDLKNNVNEWVILLRSNNIKNWQLNYNDIQIVSEDRVNEIQRLQDGDIAICMSNGSKNLVWKTGVFKAIENKVCVWAFCASFREKTSLWFARYFFQSNSYTEEIKIRLWWTNINNLKNSDIDDMLLAIPTNPAEQSKIADILSSVDELIEKTDKVIEKQKKLKEGVLSKLMREWIGHKEFKDSKLGKIPKDWEVVKLGDVFAEMKSWLSRQLNNKNIWIWVIRSNNIINNKVNFSDIKYWYLDDPQWANIEKYKLDNWDILINFINSIAQIWKTALFQSDWNEYIYTTNILRIKVNDRIINRFFMYFTQIKRYMDEIQNITKPAVNQASFTTKDFANILITIPTIKEQENICDILRDIDIDIEKEQYYKNQLQILKKGLMNKLLVGEIRLKI